MRPLDLLADARKLDARIIELGRTKNRTTALIAGVLLSMEERGHARRLGFSSTAAYVSVRLGWSGGKTRDLVGLARRLRELPLVRAAFESGELEWTKAREAARAAEAQPADEDAWLVRARTLRYEELSQLVQRALGEPVVIRRSLALSPEQVAWFEDAVRLVREEHPGRSLSQGEAVAEICRRFVHGGGLDASGAGPAGGRVRATIQVCPDCETATRETSAGPVEVARTSAERTLCDAEVFDVTVPEPRVVRTIPKRIADRLDARDRGRCRVPGCTNRAWLERHHEGGWRSGHDLERMLVLCSSHHTARHEGHLVIEGRGEAMRFMLADGTPIETPGARASALAGRATGIG